MSPSSDLEIWKGMYHTSSSWVQCVLQQVEKLSNSGILKLNESEMFFNLEVAHSVI